MILTTCAACAAPLAHDAPRCVRCKIRYCDSTCQHDHGMQQVEGTDDENSFVAAFHLATSLIRTENHAEALELLRERAPWAQRALGPDHELTLCLRRTLGASLTMNARVKADISYLRERERYLIEAEIILEDVLRRFRRVFGESHPGTKVTEEKLVFARHLKARVIAAAEELESRES